MTSNTSKQPTIKRVSKIAKALPFPSRRPSQLSAKTASKSQAVASNSKYSTTDTKQSRLIALMRRSKGATLAQLTEVTGWQAHSIRGMISGVLRKKQGLIITLDKQAGGATAYRIKA